ncbi:MAG: penicillin-insensitive murein endopeptidase [Pseudomonadota bacterium]
MSVKPQSGKFTARKISCLAGSTLGLLLLAVSGSTSANPWSTVREPFQAPGAAAKPIGSYTAGCLAAAESLAANGAGFQVMRLSRQRFFGHPELVDFIESLGIKVNTAKLGTLLVGDLSQPRGGPMLSGHRSHQTGLDVDIWYWLNSTATERMLTAEERESLNAPSMLSTDGETLDIRKWTQGNTEVLRMAAQHDQVDRIFVNPVIKGYLCRTVSPLNREWLRKLRPWWGHQDHFHVRLKCPPRQAECLAQQPVDAGPGCGKSLDWWFTAEARQVPPAPKKEVLPKLPKACHWLIETHG